MANHDAVFGRRREDECGLMLVRGQFSRGSQPRRRKRLQGAANRLCSGIRLNDAREGYSGLSVEYYPGCCAMGVGNVRERQEG
jgi:hypothetical protein